MILQLHVFQRHRDGSVKNWGEAISDTGHLPQYRSTAADSEYCCNGMDPDKSVKTRFVNSKVGVVDATHIMIHDLAHYDDLLIGDGHK